MRVPIVLPHETTDDTDMNTLQVAYLSRVRLNPYVRLMAEGVHKADSAIETSFRPTLTWRLLLPGRPDLVHVHWIELQYSYRHPPRSPERTQVWPERTQGGYRLRHCTTLGYQRGGPTPIA